MLENNHAPREEAGYDISVVIVNYNGASVLPRCIEALGRCGSALNIEVIVVDNGSSDGSADLPGEGIQKIRLDKNFGFSKANNIGAAAATGRYLLLLNSDCFVEPGLPEALVSCLDSHPEAAVAGPKLLNTDGTLQLSCHNFPAPLPFFLEQSGIWRLLRRVPGLRDRLQIAGAHDKGRRVDWLLGACMLVRPLAFKEVRGFDTGFFFYWEDADLCMRLLKRGGQTRFEPAARAVHIGGASTEDAALLLQFFRSLYRLYAKHYSTGNLVALRVIVRLMALLKAARLLPALFRVDKGGGAAVRVRAEIETWIQVVRL